MDKDGRAARWLLNSLARTHEKLIELGYHHLRFRPEVAGVQTALHPRDYTSGPVIEAYVDAEMRNGQNVCWWIDVEWNDLWVVEVSFRRHRESHQEVTLDFGRRSSEDLTEFVSFLEETVSELVAHARSFDF